MKGEKKPHMTKPMPSLFTTTVLEWYSAHGRSLPWRETKDPYAIWLSEVILQQTRIVQGTDYWHRFMQAYPTVEHLARASEDEVLRLWQGLGYYSRARHLHEAARQIMARGGTFPRTVSELRELSGVGEYTASAIASFAFNVPVPTIDGNVYRVLSRYFGISTPVNSTEGKREFAQLARELSEVVSVKGEEVSSVSTYNQAMMDFGALQCTPQNASCQSCPLMLTCEAFRTRRVASLPVKTRRAGVKTRRLTYIIIRCNGQTAIHQRGPGDIWQGLWEPFLCDIDRLPFPLTAAHSLRLVAKDVKHVLTHRLLLADCYLLQSATRPPLPADYVWINEEDIGQYAIPRLVEILIEKAKTKDLLTDES